MEFSPTTQRLRSRHGDLGALAFGRVENDGKFRGEAVVGYCSHDPAVASLLLWREVVVTTRSEAEAEAACLRSVWVVVCVVSMLWGRRRRILVGWWRRLGIGVAMRGDDYVRLAITVGFGCIKDG